MPTYGSPRSQPAADYISTMIKAYDYSHIDRLSDGSENIFIDQKKNLMRATKQPIGTKRIQ
jgi:hypothetical protein